jgi:carbon storage regulator
MLVLSRKPGEEIVIGDNIRLRVVAIRGTRVRLGITAPTEMPILRHELSCSTDGDPLDPLGSAVLPEGLDEVGPAVTGQ